MRHEPQIYDIINTCPNVWKWEKTIRNNIFKLGITFSISVIAAMFVEIVTPSSCTGLTLTVPVLM